MKPNHLLSLLLLINLINNADHAPITLQAEILEIIDGFALGVNGTTVGMIMRLRLDLNKRRVGKTSNSSPTLGFFEFEDKKYTISELVVLEKKLMESNSSEDQQRLKALHMTLTKIIDDFVELTKPFLADAHGAKGQMVVLISEWAQKAHRIDSHLLEWANVEEGKESTAIYQKIKTIALFEQFVDDLLYFLETLLRSCPKACAQFKEMMEQKQKESAAAK
ncbi:MAG: hypothetical protein AMXMBFR12_02440 [Candidatus Babeliales bacterium]